MAYGDRKCADSADPRDFHWLPYAWQDGAMCPYKWFIKTTGVTAYFQRLNDGLVLPVYGVGLEQVEWKLFDFYPIGPSWSLRITAYKDIRPGPPVHNIVFNFGVFLNLPDIIVASGSVLELSTYAIAERSVTMMYGAEPSEWFPNPVTITPVPWNTPDSPAG
jgi:hypothetical protein